MELPPTAAAREAEIEWQGSANADIELYFGQSPGQSLRYLCRVARQQGLHHFFRKPH